jgi:transposase
LTPYKRGLLVGAKISGSSPAEIARTFNLKDSTVRTTLQRAQERDDGHSKPRSGQPRCMSDREERILIRHIRLNPRDTFDQVKTATKLKISTSTIKNICRKVGISYWRAKKWPALTEKAVEARFEWAKAYKDWTIEQ